MSNIGQIERLQSNCKALLTNCFSREEAPTGPIPTLLSLMNYGCEGTLGPIGQAWGKQDAHFSVSRS
jgi:hypothetical protein